MSRGFVLPSQISPPIAAAAGALTLIAAGSGALSGSSVAFTNCFSATYDAYRLITTGIYGSAAETMTIIFGAAATGYYNAAIRVNDASAVSAQNVQNHTSSMRTAQISDGANAGAGCTLDITNPFLAYGTGVAYSNYSRANGWFQSGAGMLFTTTSYTGYTLAITGGATFTAGTAKLYGYALS